MTKAPLRVRWDAPYPTPQCWRRVKEALANVKHLPDGITLVEGSGGEDLVIHDVFNHSHCDRMVPGKRYVLILHGVGDATILPALRKAVLSVGFMDVPEATGASDFAFLRTPWGVDGNLFAPRGGQRPHVIMTMGDDNEGEVLRECFMAAREARGLRGTPVHVGQPYDWGCNPTIYRNVFDDQMVSIYSSTLYVSGLRRGAGFELPVIEGLACGARPICFDTPWYRHWFDGHALFIPVTPNPTADLVEIFRKDPEPVSAEERAEVLRKFNWATIAEAFWKRVLESA